MPLLLFGTEILTKYLTIYPAINPATIAPKNSEPASVSKKNGSPIKYTPNIPRIITGFSPIDDAKNPANNGIINKKAALPTLNNPFQKYSIVESISNPHAVIYPVSESILINKCYK